MTQRRTHRSLLVLALACGLLLPACAPVGPNYRPPKPAAPAAWNSPVQGGIKAAKADPAALARWWRTLKDPILTALVKEAVSGNLGLKMAKARVRAARALRGVNRARLYPGFGSSASYLARRGSASGDIGGEERTLTAGFDAAWEIDVFGGVRRRVEAAQADLEAARASYRDVLVSLAAEVGRNYVEVRTYQARLAVATANLAAQERIYSFIRSRHVAGLINNLALRQAAYNLEATRSQIPVLRTGLAAAMNRLAVLIGKAPGAVHQRLAVLHPVPTPPLAVAVGVPAEALRRRPDIRLAERRLAAAVARVGVAVAELYPKFRLGGSIGLEAIKTSRFLDASSTFWTFLPAITWRIFDGGALRRNIEATEAVAAEQALAYRSAVLGALEEVENALVAYAQEQMRRNSLRKAVAAALEAATLSQDLYRAGLINFDSVLEAQRSLLLYQDQLAVSEGAVTSRLIALYKALGGGWAPLGRVLPKAGMRPARAKPSDKIGVRNS